MVDRFDCEFGIGGRARAKRLLLAQAWPVKSCKDPGTPMDQRHCHLRRNGKIRKELNGFDPVQSFKYINFGPVFSSDPWMLFFFRLTLKHKYFSVTLAIVLRHLCLFF